MRSYEPFNGPFFVQPLTTEQRWPLSFTHTWESDGLHRFCPRTVVIRVHTFCWFLVFLLAWPFAPYSLLWCYFVEAVLIVMLYTLVRRTSGLAFGIWRKGTPMVEIEARQRRAWIKAEYMAYVAVNGPTSFVTWLIWWKAGEDQGFEGEELTLYVQEGIHGTD